MIWKRRARREQDAVVSTILRAPAIVHRSLENGGKMAVYHEGIMWRAFCGRCLAHVDVGGFHHWRSAIICAETHREERH